MINGFIKIKRTLWFKLHWRVGVVAALFLTLLAVTGIVLNHARALGLDHIYLDAPWILQAYNMEMPEGYIKSIEETSSSIVVQTADGSLVLGRDVEDVEAAVAVQYRGEGVTLEKLLLDIHTGAIVGLPGKILSDLTALALLFLTGTGLYNLWRRKRG